MTTISPVDYLYTKYNLSLFNFQSQFEDLQVECKKVREDYNKVVKELDRVKSTG